MTRWYPLSTRLNPCHTVTRRARSLDRPRFERPRRGLRRGGHCGRPRARAGQCPRAGHRIPREATTRSWSSEARCIPTSTRSSPGSSVRRSSCRSARGEGAGVRCLPRCADARARRGREGRSGVRAGDRVARHRSDRRRRQTPFSARFPSGRPSSSGTTTHSRFPPPARSSPGARSARRHSVSRSPRGVSSSTRKSRCRCSRPGRARAPTSCPWQPTSSGGSRRRASTGRPIGKSTCHRFSPRSVGGLGRARPLVPGAGVVSRVVACAPKHLHGEARATARMAVRDDLDPLDQPDERAHLFRASALEQLLEREVRRAGCGHDEDRSAHGRGRRTRLASSRRGARGRRRRGADGFRRASRLPLTHELEKHLVEPVGLLDAGESDPRPETPRASRAGHSRRARSTPHGDHLVSVADANEQRAAERRRDPREIHPVPHRLLRDGEELPRAPPSRLGRNTFLPQHRDPCRRARASRSNSRRMRAKRRGPCHDVLGRPAGKGKRAVASHRRTDGDELVVVVPQELCGPAVDGRPATVETRDERLDTGLRRAVT